MCVLEMKSWALMTGALAHVLELRAHFQVSADQTQNRGLSLLSGSWFSAFCYQHLQRQKHSESTLSPVVSETCNSICCVTKYFPCFCCMEELMPATPHPHPTLCQCLPGSSQIPASRGTHLKHGWDVQQLPLHSCTWWWSSVRKRS